MSSVPPVEISVDAWAQRQKRISVAFGAAILVLVVGAVAFIWYIASTVSAAREELERVNVQLSEARGDLKSSLEDLEEARAQLAALEEQIGLSVGFVQYLHPVDLEDAKLISNSSDRLARLLELILSLQNEQIPFSSANEPIVGFNSPGFADFVLGKIDPEKRVENLPLTETPKLGDIITYKGGFFMFLLQDSQAEPFVIGMTPGGIAALEPDFGVPNTGALATGLLTE